MVGPSPDASRRPWGCLGCAGVVVVAFLALVGLSAWDRWRGPSEIVDDTVEFAADEDPTRAPAGGRRGKGSDTYDDGADWPLYGRNQQRTRYMPFTGRTSIRPPFRERWGMTSSVLLEFPPILCGRRLYVLRNDARLVAFHRRSGRKAWTRRVGRLAASSPACAKGRLFVTILERGRGTKGLVAAYSTGGRRLWQRRLASRTESSPLLAGDKLIFGTEGGDVLAMSPRTGRVLWRYRAGAPVKAAVARRDGLLYVGDYDGRMHAFTLSKGRRRWVTNLGAGRLYSTPAVAYGRVYVGGVGGAVVAVGARSGRVAWRRRADGYVYSAPAVAPVAGRGPTVFIGSYGGKLYALDARTGRPRWIRDVGGRISGGVTVIGDLVMYANRGQKTVGIRHARDGRRIYGFRSGGYDPGISDGRRLYLVSFTSVYHLTPRAQARRDDRSLRQARRRR
ncbi:MAG: PQQ-like beta-propeller repeat protein [Solirubrobacteraceae bacterium]|nr:PQQ-like beta-propeller repeat protein [Solirubrobacteraceae bacterium]